MVRDIDSRFQKLYEYLRETVMTQDKKTTQNTQYTKQRAKMNEMGQ